MISSVCQMIPRVCQIISNVCVKKISSVCQMISKRGKALLTWPRWSMVYSEPRSDFLRASRRAASSAACTCASCCFCACRVRISSSSLSLSSISCQPALPVNTCQKPQARISTTTPWCSVRPGLPLLSPWHESAERRRGEGGGGEEREGGGGSRESMFE